MFFDVTTHDNPYDQSAQSLDQRLGEMQSQSPWGGNSLATRAAGAMGNTAQNYPSYPNPYGLGSGNPNGGGPGGTSLNLNGESGPNFSRAPITVETPDTTSRGMNPWSMIGEANARTSPPPGGGGPWGGS